MTEVREKLIDLMIQAKRPPRKVSESGLIYFEDCFVAITEDTLKVFFDIDTYPSAVVGLTVMFYVFSRSNNLKFELGDMYTPTFNALGEVTDLAFGHDAIVAYEAASKQYYLNQSYFTEFLKKVDFKELHQC